MTLLGRYIAKLLYGWGNKKSDQKYIGNRWKKIGDDGKGIHSLDIAGAYF